MFLIQNKQHPHTVTAGTFLYHTTYLIHLHLDRYLHTFKQNDHRPPRALILTHAEV